MPKLDVFGRSTEEAARVAKFVHLLAATNDLLKPPESLEPAVARVSVHERVTGESRRATIGLGLGAVPQGQTQERIDRPRLRDVSRRRGHTSGIAHRPHSLFAVRDDFLADEVRHAKIDIA